MKNIQFPAGIAAVLFLNLFLLASCHKKRYHGSEDGCGGYDPNTNPIAGPTIGHAGNDHDNPFRSLAIDPHNPQLIYMGSEGNGVFRSVDGGTNWDWLRTGILHCDAYAETYNIAIDPANSAHLVMATNSGPGPAVGNYITATGGIYVSQDSGSHWMHGNTGLPTGDANSIAIAPDDPNTLITGLGGSDGTNFNTSGKASPGGVFISHNNGGAWMPAYTGTPLAINQLYQMEVRGSGSGYTLYTLGTYSGFYARNSGGLYKGTAQGTQWTALFPTVLQDTIDGSFFDVSLDQQIIYVNEYSYNPRPGASWRSPDGGQTWVRTTKSGTGPIRILGTNNNLVLYSDGSSLYRSTDGMHTSVPVFTVPDPNLNTIMDIEVAPSNPAIIYVATQGLLVYRSTDAGLHFSQVANMRDYINHY